MKALRLLVLLAIVGAVGAPAARSGEIHDAVNAGDRDRVARLLREKPAAVSEAWSEGSNDLPLHLAAARGDVEMARLLIDAGARVDGLDVDGSTPLHVAALRRKPDMLRFLLAKGGDVKLRDRNGAYSLSFAAAGGDSTCVEMVLAAGADLNFTSPQGMTLLHFACSRGLWKFADLLQARGLDINCRNGEGATPLHLTATTNDSLRVVRLIARGADVNAADSSGATPLLEAATANAVRSMRALLKAGANPNLPTHTGLVPLHVAAWRGQPEVARALLAGGADPNRASNDGETPLMGATAGGRTEFVASLLEHGARATVTGRQHSWTPMHVACLRGQLGLAQTLLTGGAELNRPDDRGLTPLDLAVRYGHQKVAEYLKSRGATAAAPPADGPCGLAAARDLPPGEAMVWNLGHSGWGIKTRNHFLVFDYFPDAMGPDQPGLCNGTIDPAELAGENVTVFASHSHRDHFDPVIFTWRERIPKISYVLGFRPDNAPANAPAAEILGPRESRAIDGMKVTTIQANDSGAGFVVEVDGLVLFHAGDHANRVRDLTGNYPPEIQFLKAWSVHPDIAFLPVSGCGFGDQVAVRIGTEYTLDQLQPALFIPMHNGSFGSRCTSFVTEVQGRHPGVGMKALECRGDHVVYRKGSPS